MGRTAGTAMLEGMAEAVEETELEEAEARTLLKTCVRLLHDLDWDAAPEVTHPLARSVLIEMGEIEPERSETADVEELRDSLRRAAGAALGRSLHFAEGEDEVTPPAPTGRTRAVDPAAATLFAAYLFGVLALLGVWATMGERGRLDDWEVFAWTVLFVALWPLTLPAAKIVGWLKRRRP